MRHHFYSLFITSLLIPPLLVDTTTTQAKADTPPQTREPKNPAKTNKRSQRPKNPAMAPVEDVEGLPRVLLIGDSISIGYTVPARDALRGKANVHRPLTNCGPTTRGLEGLSQWLGETDWDVITNWGLHDLKYLGPNDENLQDPKDPKNHQQVPPKNMNKICNSLFLNLKRQVPFLFGEIQHLYLPDQRAELKAMLPFIMKSPSRSWRNMELKYDMYGLVKPQMDPMLPNGNALYKRGL